MAFLGFFVSLILMTVVVLVFFNPYKAGESSSTKAAYVIPVLVGGFVVGEGLTFLIGRRLINRDNTKNAALMKELEGLEKNEPRFIAWDELTSGTRGMSVH